MCTFVHLSMCACVCVSRGVALVDGGDALCTQINTYTREALIFHSFSIKVKLFPLMYVIKLALVTYSIRDHISKLKEFL